ncbi:hypothetical protein [Nonomuraea soli]|uniref:Uncharacterized protein n=1 Tax=Nonomuraea soli TaxID=1032476 RepID=A0A7W0CD27_9ACTN|nr:hypothetical protein [Nonomuraea soli]MBA2888936.1 hypothetical protein [Nonomuraea soli]
MPVRPARDTYRALLALDFESGHAPPPHEGAVPGPAADLEEALAMALAGGELDAWVVVTAADELAVLLTCDQRLTPSRYRHRLVEAGVAAERLAGLLPHRVRLGDLPESCPLLPRSARVLAVVELSR